MGKIDKIELKFLFTMLALNISFFKMQFEEKRLIHVYVELCMIDLGLICL